MKNIASKIFPLYALKCLLLGATVLLGTSALGPGSACAGESVKTSFLYNLSNFSGPIPYNWANLHADKERGEIYVVDIRERDVRVFNGEGMEVYRFGDDGSLGGVLDVVAKKNGEILVLSQGRSGSRIILCNYRGEVVSELTLKELPPDFSRFSPDRLVLREGMLYLMDSAYMRIAVTDPRGHFQRGYDLAPLLGVKEAKRGETEIGGFSIDEQGNMLFTVPVLFAAYRLSPEGELKGFGRPGSAPGRFGVVGGIVADERGNYYVADRLKSVVLIFDRDFRFLREFGYRGIRPDNLIGPKNLVLDDRGRLYVSQLRSRGVSVFKITYN